MLSNTRADVSMWAVLITQAQLLISIYPARRGDAYSRLSVCLTGSRWVNFNLVLSDRLISALSTSTAAPPVKANHLLWGRRRPPSNKAGELISHRVTCEVRSQDTEDTTINVRTCGIDERCQKWPELSVGPCRHSAGVSWAWSWLIQNVFSSGITVM